MVYFTSNVIFTFTLNSDTSLSFTTTLCDCTKADLICFTLFDACSTAFFVASSQLTSENLPLLQ